MDISAVCQVWRLGKTTSSTHSTTRGVLSCFHSPALSPRNLSRFSMSFWDANQRDLTKVSWKHDANHRRRFWFHVDVKAGMCIHLSHVRPEGSHDVIGVSCGHRWWGPRGQLLQTPRVDPDILGQRCSPHWYMNYWWRSTTSLEIMRLWSCHRRHDPIMKEMSMMPIGSLGPSKG